MNIRNLSLLALSFTLIDVTCVIGMHKNLSRSDSIANFHKKELTKHITPQEYIKMVENFLEVNQETFWGYYWDINSKDIIKKMTDEYNRVLIRLRNIGETFGFKEYPKEVSGDVPILSIDISWPNLRVRIVDFLNNELRNEGNKWKSFGNIKFDFKTGTRIQDIRELETLKDDQPITLWHLDALVSEFASMSPDGKSNLEAWQLDLLVKLCLKTKKNGESRLFDISNLTEEDKGFFAGMLKEMLKSKTGFQRIMGLLSIGIINNSRENIKITFDKKEITSYHPCHRRININLSKSESLYGPNNLISSEEKCSESLLHESTHAYHHMIGYHSNIFYMTKWFSSFSVLNAPVNLISEFFPMLLPNNMNEVINRISRYIEGKQIDEEQKLTWIYYIMCNGFGSLLFDEFPTNMDDLKIEVLSQQKDFLAKCVYITACLSPIWNKDWDDLGVETEGDFAWTNQEERLTIRGSDFFLVGNDCCMVEDRQNEQIYAMRSSQKSVNPQYFYWLHIADYEKCVEENLKDVLSNFQDSSSNCVSLLWGRIKSYFDSWLIKTNVSDEGLDKFKEQNSDNLTEYKTSSTVIPYSLDFLSPVNLHCYNLENDLNLIITDIENAKVDFKTVNLEWDTLWEYGGVSILEKILNVAKMRNIDLELFMPDIEKLVNFYIENGSLEGFKLLCEYESQVN